MTFYMQVANLILQSTGKNNYKTRAEKAANKKHRFTLKKLSVGVASVAVGATLFLGNGQAVSAEEQPDETEALDQGDETESPDEAEDSEEADLEAAKESAKAELQAAGATSPKLAEYIDFADTVEEVERLKNDFLDVRRQQLEQDQAAEEQPDETETPDQGDETEAPDEAEDSEEADLEAAKETAKAELQAAGATSPKLAEYIDFADSVEEVERLKNDFLDVRRQQVEQDQEVEGEAPEDEGQTPSEPGQEKPEDGSEDEEAQALQAAKESAKAELQAAGATSPKLAEYIDSADSVEEVDRLKNDFLEVRRQQVEQNQAADEDVDNGSDDTEKPGEDDEGETAEEVVYTLYYYTQNTKGKNGATTVKATSVEEALEYFQNFASENGLGDLDWFYNEESKSFTAREKVEADDDSDTEAPDESDTPTDPDDSSDQDGDDDSTDTDDPDDTDEVGSQESVYTLVYLTPNTNGKNGATTVKASSAEQAEKYFKNFVNENGLGDLEWSYDEDTKTFTAIEKSNDTPDTDEDLVEENNETGFSTKEAAEAAAEEALETDKVNNSYSVAQGADGRWYYVLSPNLPEESGDDTQEPDDDVEENNETGFSTKEAAEAAAEEVLETDKVNNSYSVAQGADGRWYYVLSPNLPEESDDNDSEEQRLAILQASKDAFNEYLKTSEDEAALINNAETVGEVVDAANTIIDGRIAANAQEEQARAAAFQAIKAALNENLNASEDEAALINNAQSVGEVVDAANTIIDGRIAANAQEEQRLAILQASKDAFNEYLKTSEDEAALVNEADSLKDIVDAANTIIDGRIAANAQEEQARAADFQAKKETTITELQEILNDVLSDEEKSLIVDAYTVEEVEAAKDTIIEGREEVYTLIYTIDGEEDYRNTKAVHPGEAREAFLDFIRQENLDVDVIVYDKDTKSFRAFGGEQPYYFHYSKDGELYIDGTKAQHPGEALEIIRDYIEETDLEVTNLFYDERTNTFHAVLEDNSGVKTDETVYESLPEELSWDEISDEADELAEQYLPLFKAQDSALEALKSLGITSERLFDEIREATSVEEVEQLATSILETRKQQLLQNPEAVKALSIQRLEADGALTENQRALLTDAETHEEIAQASEVVTVQREVISNLNEGLAEDLSSEEEDLITNTSTVKEVHTAAETILNAREQKAAEL